MILSKTLHRYGDKANSHDLVKFLAMICMFFDHSGLYLLDNNHWFRLIGRIAAPLFFFVLGYANHHKFRLNILVYGILLTLITLFTEHTIYINILINFVIIKWALNRYDFSQLPKSQLILILLGLLIVLIPCEVWLEYGVFGLLFAIGAQLLAKKDAFGNRVILIALIAYFSYESIAFNFIHFPVLEILFAGICLALATIMIFYQLKMFSIPTLFRYPILFISRYSLQLYFLHLAALKIYAGYF